MSNFWEAAKAVHRGKYIALDDYIRKDKRFKVNDLHFYFKNLEKRTNQTLKPKVRREEVVKTQIQMK